MPPVDSKYAQKKLGKTKWEKVKAIARRFHWGCENDLYPSEVGLLARCKTTEELQIQMEDFHAFRDALGGPITPHLKLIQEGGTG